MYIPLAKYQALLAGDKSGAVIHPFFICFAHLVGCQVRIPASICSPNFTLDQFYQERAGSQFLLPIQADHLQSCIEAFATMKEKIDPPGYLLACYSLHLLYGCFHAASSSNEFYKRCTKVIRRNNLRFVPKSSQGQVISSQTPEFTEYAHERIALLAQIVASEATIYICGLPGGAGSLDWHFSKFDVPVRSKTKQLFSQANRHFNRTCMLKSMQTDCTPKTYHGISRTSSSTVCRSVFRLLYFLDLKSYDFTRKFTLFCSRFAPLYCECAACFLPKIRKACYRAFTKTVRDRCRHCFQFSRHIQSHTQRSLVYHIPCAFVALDEPSR